MQKMYYQQKPSITKHVNLSNTQIKKFENSIISSYRIIERVIVNIPKKILIIIHVNNFLTVTLKIIINSAKGNVDIAFKESISQFILIKFLESS